MVLYKPATVATDAIARPACEKCGNRTWLARIEPDRPGYERRTFECPSCGKQWRARIVGDDAVPLPQPEAAEEKVAPWA